MNEIRLTENGFSVTACGRTWASAEWKCRILRKDGGVSYFADADCETKPFRTGAGQGFSQTYSNFEGIPGLRLECRSWVETATGDVVFELIPLTDAGVREILWPAPFSNDDPKAYTVLPLMQGALIPNYTEAVFPDAWDIIPGYTEYRWSCSRSMYMQFFGQYDKNGACMTIFETRYDGGMTVNSGKGKPVLTAVRWRESLGKVGYVRRLRVKFFAPGADHNDLAKAYRAYIRSIGELVTLKEKAAANPKVLDLIGRPIVHTYIWYHTQPDSTAYDREHPEKNDRMQSFDAVGDGLRRLKEQGVSKALLHLDGWGRRGYDNQHPDYLPPAQALGGWDGMKRLSETCHELGYFFGTHDQYRDYFYDADTFDEALAVHNEDGGVSSHAIWMGGKQTFLCATQAAYYVRRNFAALKEHGIFLDNTYLDVFSCVELDECFHPVHPMTREECAHERMRCFREAAKDGILVQSEEGIDWAFPGLAFLHHAPFAPDDGKGGIGIRIPLLELVYHDCIVTPQYDLFAYLTGGASYLDLHADENGIAECKRRTEWQEQVQMREMTHHELIDNGPDRQRTEFSGGCAAEIDLKKKTYTLTIPGEEDIHGSI